MSSALKNLEEQRTRLQDENETRRQKDHDAWMRLHRRLEVSAAGEKEKRRLLAEALRGKCTFCYLKPADAYAQKLCVDCRKLMD